MGTQLQLDFYNTIHESGQVLKSSQEQAQKQGERVHNIFLMHRNCAFTPAEIHSAYERLYDRTPLTSIRRAITNLTELGKLRKLPEMKEGIYGKPNHKWQLI